MSRIFNSKEVRELEEIALKKNMNIIQRALFKLSQNLALEVDHILNPEDDCGLYIDTHAPDALTNEAHLYESADAALAPMKGVLFQARAMAALQEAFAKATDYTDEVLGNPERYQPFSRALSTLSPPNKNNF